MQACITFANEEVVRRSKFSKRVYYACITKQVLVLEQYILNSCDKDCQDLTMTFMNRNF